MTASKVGLALALTCQLACASHAARPPSEPSRCDRGWPHWEAYATRFLSEDGRVIDLSAEGHSTSEGQAYGLFFALVADDRPRFDAILAWTRANLAKGDLTANLPSWRWGHRADGSWGVLDENAASDADLWIAYALIEAGRLWGDAALAAEGSGLLARVAAAEVRELPALGPTLLPGPMGFADGAGTWRLNPSYLPIQLLRRSAAVAPDGPWAEVLASSARLLRGVAPRGLYPDWAAWRDGVGFVADPVHGARGSYDAIRVYLWSATLSPEDPLAAALGEAGHGMLALTGARGDVPEVVDAGAGGGAPGRAGPVGFAGALLPAALRAGRGDIAARLRATIERARRGPLYGDPPRYYDQNLLLFGLGFAEGYYRFLADGSLEPRWSSPCTER